MLFGCMYASLDFSVVLYVFKFINKHYFVFL